MRCPTSVLVLLNQIGQTVNQFAALGSRRPAPRALRMKRLASRFNGKIDVRGVGFGHPRDDIASGRIDRLKGFAGQALNPLIADQNLGLHDGNLRRFGNAKSWCCHVLFMVLL